MKTVKDFFIKIGNKIKSNFGFKSCILIGVFVALLVVDLVTKHFEEAENWKFTVIPGFIEVESGVRNPGAGFSWLADKAWGQPFLIGLTVVMIVAVICIILALPEKFTILKLSLYMILAGAVGNLVDRIMFGEVRDFVWLLIVNAYCNFADFWIVIGGILAVIDMLFLNEVSVFPLTASAKAAQAERRKEEQEKKQASVQPSSENAAENENSVESNSAPSLEGQSQSDVNKGDERDE
ncbi:MAG TPA: signal peptidase II [Candidatus Coproplasma excrementavium]|nr:signal peptidase II [Candidatus Coproplasma excrementavium]